MREKWILAFGIVLGGLAAIVGMLLAHHMNGTAPWQSAPEQRCTLFYADERRYELCVEVPTPDDREYH